MTTPNTAPDANTFDLDPPRRPGANDFNGIAKVNALDLEPADPETDPTAEEWNTLCHTGLAVGQVAALAFVKIDGGASPSILGVISPSTNVTGVTFTLDRVGAGHLTLKWPTSGAAALPPKFSARASVIEDAEIDRVRVFDWAAAGAGFQGVEIVTKLGATGTDVDLLVEIL